MVRKITGILILVCLVMFAATSHAATQLPQLSLNIGGGQSQQEIAGVIKIFLVLTLLSVAPAILLTMTSFTRIVVVISFLRQAIGVHQSPPNQVVIGLALFLTFFIMSPVIQGIQ